MPSIEELQLLNHVLDTKDWNVVEDHKLVEDHFPIHKDAFHFIKGFQKQHGTMPTVETVLNKYDTFQTVDLENVKAVVNALQEDLYHRKVKPILVDISTKVANKQTLEAISQMQAEANKFLKSIGTQSQGYSYIGNAQARLDKYLEIHGRDEDDILGMSTGFEPLDKAVNGIELGDHGAVDYFLVFAPTNMGKTLMSSFMQQAGWNDMTRHDYPAYFALEQQAEEIARNWDNVLGQVSRLALSRGTMSAEMKDRYVEFIDRLKVKKRDMVIYDLSSNGGKPYTVDEIRRILEREGHTRFTLDQLSKVRLSGKFSGGGGDLRQRLFDTSAEVREMILDTKKAGYVVAQANRDAFKRVKKDAEEGVDAGDIGEAFAIVQDASKGISIVKVDDNTFRITVIKGRDNSSGQHFLVRYDFESGIVLPLNSDLGEQFF